jgi:hypothetical protein
MKFHIEQNVLAEAIRWAEDQDSGDEEFVVLSSSPEQINVLEESLNILFKGLPFEVSTDARYLKEKAQVKGDVLVPDPKKKYATKQHDRIVVRRIGYV